MTFTVSNDINTIARRLSALESSVRTLRASVPRSIAGLTFPADSKDPFWTGSNDSDGVVMADFDAAKDCSVTVGPGLWILEGFAWIVNATAETGVNIGLAADAAKPTQTGQRVCLSTGSGAVASAVLVEGPGECRAVRYVNGDGGGSVQQVRLVALPVHIKED